MTRIIIGASRIFRKEVIETYIRNAGLDAQLQNYSGNVFTAPPWGKLYSLCVNGEVPNKVVVEQLKEIKGIYQIKVEQ